jgi:hypothetical protein
VHAQVEHLLPVAQLLELRAEIADQPLDRHRGRDRHRRPGQVEQVAFEPGAGRPPHRRAVQRRPGAFQRPPGAVVLLRPQRQPAEQAGEQHDGVHVRARVGHPQLHRGQVG